MPHTSRVMKTDSRINIVILVEKINHFALKYSSPVIPGAGCFDFNNERYSLHSQPFSSLWLWEEVTAHHDVRTDPRGENDCGSLSRWSTMSYCAISIHRGWTGGAVPGIFS